MGWYVPDDRRKLLLRSAAVVVSRAVCGRRLLTVPACCDRLLSQMASRRRSRGLQGRLLLRGLRLGQLRVLAQLQLLQQALGGAGRRGARPVPRRCPRLRQRLLALHRRIAGQRWEACANRPPRSPHSQLLLTWAPQALNSQREREHGDGFHTVAHGTASFGL